MRLAVCLAALCGVVSSLTLRAAVDTATQTPRTTPRTRTKAPPGDRGDSPFEYYLDADARRNPDGFHLLLLGNTFTKPRMTVPYAAGALVMCIGMDEPTALEHSSFAADNGMSCLGNWERSECLELAKQCAQRDLSVRVVPGVRGKHAWQKDPANTTPQGLPPA
eukprot:CAMPEP_0197387244 /NCGR_PEP_ID=MMETSP1165-20131217/411_1 /TAXON_ID=284809 /ORGANISM="Chrysocystis fragilis, Strain CCMP3189" /LENGTH=163 /DNA_ID=CAMNT_0042912557 /DNA_START=67 /DNA_END=558 /DNA_ORIENTATION=+